MNLKDQIIKIIIEKYKNKLQSIYGIGSKFEQSINIKSDVDVIVLLKDIKDAPYVDWTDARFEVKKIDDIEIWFLYGDLKHYLNPNIFSHISFANWEWAVRSLKYGSTLLFGDDIRSKLPTPPYNLPQIFKRSMYYLEPTPEWKFKSALKRGKKIDDQMRLSKSIFKYGFFIVASVFPDENEFSKNGIFKLLKKAVVMKYTNKKILKYYQDAINFRNGDPFPNFKKYRKEFMIYSVKESMRHLETDWSGDEEKKGIKDLLLEGMGKYPFSIILLYYQNYGMTKKY